jgi:hypothetical protein
MAVLLLAAGLASLLAATIPTVVPDVKTYHLGAPEAYLAAHRIYEHHWDWSWHLGLATEDVLLPVYALGGVVAAKAVNMALLASVWMVLAIVGARWIGGSAGWWAGALFAGCGLVPSATLFGKTDLGSILAVTAAAGCLLGSRRPAAWLAAGCLAGWAFTAKFTAGFAVAGLLVAGWFAQPQPRRGSGPVLFALGGLSATGPLLAANWLWLHAPLYPFGARLTGGLGWTPALDAAVRGAWKTLLGITDLSPGALVANALWFGRPEFGSLALGLLLPVALFRKPAGALAGLAPVRTFLLITYGGLLVCNQYPRYMGLLLPLACLLAATALPRGRAGRVAVAALVLASAGLESVQLASRGAPATLGFLAGQVPGAALAVPAGEPATRAAVALDGQFGLHDRVLIGWEQRFLGLRARQFSMTIWAPGPLWTWARESADAAAMAKRFRQEGITGVAHNLIRARFAQRVWEHGPAWDARSLRVYREFVERYWTIVDGPEVATFEGGDYYAWRVARVPHRPASTLLVLPGAEFALMPEPASPDEELRQLQVRATLYGGALDARDAVAGSLAGLHRDREALAIYRAERAAGYLNEHNLAWHAAVLRSLGRDREARTVEADALALSGGDAAALLHNPVAERLYPFLR